MQSHVNIENDDVLSDEPKDRTKWLWLVVVILLAGMVAALWAVNRVGNDVTLVRAKHILIKFNKEDPADRARALELITNLRKEIEDGASFSKLAKEYSNDELSSARGGDLGYHKEGLYEGAFEEYVWTAPIGQLSDIVQTSSGFHLIVVTDRHISKADAYEVELEKKARAAQKQQK